MGAFSHSANYYGDYPGNNPENHPPCGIMHNQFKTQKFKHLMLAMGPRDLNSAPYSPVHCSSHSMTSFQSSELTELPVVENSQLFAQRAHSARYAPPRGQPRRTFRRMFLSRLRHAQSQTSGCNVQRVAVLGNPPRPGAVASPGPKVKGKHGHATQRALFHNAIGAGRSTSCRALPHLGPDTPARTLEGPTKRTLPANSGLELKWERRSR